MVTLTFTEPVVPVTLSLIGVGGAPQTLEVQQPDGSIVDAMLPSGLADGSYLLSWRVTSADGHPVSGTLDFAIGAASATISVTTQAFPLAPAIWLVRALQYAALFLGVGSLAFGALAHLPVRTAVLVRLLAAGGLILVPPALALHGLDLTGLPVGALLTGQLWSAVSTSPYTLTQTAMSAAFGLALLPFRWSAVLAAFAGTVSLLFSGHAVTAPPGVLMRIALFTHIASLMFWLGALVPLFGLLRVGDHVALRRFSRLIPYVVALLILSGGTLALVQLGPLSVDWLSPYGVLLGTKLLLVVALLLIALWNRRILTLRAISGNTGPLRRSIVVELVVVVAILGIVAGWRFTAPPRVLAEIAAAQAPLGVYITGNDMSGTVYLTPGRVGVVTVDLKLSAPAQSVTVRLSNPGKQIAPISRSATQGADGDWRAAATVLLPAGGDWQVAIDARVGDFELHKLSGSFTLPAAGKDTAVKRTVIAAATTAVLATSALASPGVLPQCPANQVFTAGDLSISGGFTRATLPSAKVAGGYFTIENKGSAPDTLLGAELEAAATLQLHQMKMDGDVMKMGEVADGLEIAPGQSVALTPGGYHLMMMGLKAPFVEGQCVEITLKFETAGEVPVVLSIGGVGADAAPMDGMKMDMPMDHNMDAPAQ